MYANEEEPLHVLIVHVSTSSDYNESDYCVIAFFTLYLAFFALYVLIPMCKQRRQSPQVLATVEAYPITDLKV
jgi:hypothetical protein